MTDTIRVTVATPDGRRDTYEGLEGYSVMEVIRDNGLPIKAECGGCMCCATCAVVVSPDWQDRINPATADEEDLVMDAGLDASARLSCQIVLDPSLDGLEVTLLPQDV